MLVHPAQLLLGFSALCGLSNAQVTLLGVVPPEFSSISAEGGCILGTPSFSSLETLQDGQIRYLEEIALPQYTTEYISGSPTTVPATTVTGFVVADASRLVYSDAEGYVRQSCGFEPSVGARGTCVDEFLDVLASLSGSTSVFTASTYTGIVSPYYTLALAAATPTANQRGQQSSATAGSMAPPPQNTSARRRNASFGVAMSSLAGCAVGCAGCLMLW